MSTFTLWFNTLFRQTFYGMDKLCTFFFYLFMWEKCICYFVEPCQCKQPSDLPNVLKQLVSGNPGRRGKALLPQWACINFLMDTQVWRAALLYYKYGSRIIEPLNILSWKRPRRIIEINSWLHTGSSKIQKLCLRALS